MRARFASSFFLLSSALFFASCAAPPTPTLPSQSRPESSAAAGQPSTADAEQRPGLGTGWGETRESRIRITRFRRASENPLATAAIHYNDAAGIRAMAGAVRPRRTRPSIAGTAGSLVSVELRDGRGRLLPGLAVGDRWFVIGEEGGRYSIVVRNRREFRVEVVLSVDGLDVLDGRAASFRKRGYLIPPLGVVRVEGFRRSTEAVAAFRFSSVSDSYANRKYGETRNVGVIGIAVFNEYGSDPNDLSEVERRFGADPFPGRFATSPEPIPFRPPRQP